METTEYLHILRKGIPESILKKLEALSPDQTILTDLLEVFTERAGFRQYAAHMKQAEAEVCALQDTILYYYRSYEAPKPSVLKP
jgi:chorismate mutase